MTVRMVNQIKICVDNRFFCIEKAISIMIFDNVYDSLSNSMIHNKEHSVLFAR
jgi:hypothetical protein